MKKLLVLAWAGAALLSGGMLRAENILLSTRNSSLLLTAEKGKTPLFQYFGSARRLARRHPRQRSGVRRCGLPAVRRPVLPRGSHSGDARRRFDVARTGGRVGVARPQERLRNHRHRHEGQALPVFRDALLQDLRRLRGDRDVDRDQPHGEETRDALPVRIGPTCPSAGATRG